MVNQQGVHGAISIRKNRIMYTWPDEIAESSNPVREVEEALSGLTLLRRTRSADTEPATVSPKSQPVIDSTVSAFLSTFPTHSTDLILLTTFHLPLSLSLNNL